HAPEAWSPTSDTLVFSLTRGSAVSLSSLSLRTRKTTPFGDVHGPDAIAHAATFSPNGRWLAYTSIERARTTVSVQPFPATGATYQLFANQSDDPHHPVWSRDGKELFYIARPGGFESVAVTAAPTFAFGNPKALPGPFILGPPWARRAYDVTPGG